MIFKISAKFNNTESAQAAGRRIRELNGIRGIHFFSEHEVIQNNHGNIVYGTNITTTRGYLTSSGRLSVNPVFDGEEECFISVLADKDVTPRARNIIFNSGGYDCTITKFESSTQK